MTKKEKLINNLIAFIDQNLWNGGTDRKRLLTSGLDEVTKSKVEHARILIILVQKSVISVGQNITEKNNFSNVISEY